MSSVLILLSAFDPGTYYIEDNGNPNDGIAQLRGPDGSIIPFSIPTESLTVTASAGRSVIINLTEWNPAADINVGSLTDSTQNPDSITVANIRGAADVMLASNGAITELGSDAAADIRANTVILSAGTGVGTPGNALETQVGTLEAETTTGGINLANTGNLTIGGLTDDVGGLDVDTSGDILLTNTGSIILSEESPGAFESIHGGSSSGNVTLIANGADSDIVSNVDHDTIAAAGGSVTLTAGRDVSLGTFGANFDNDVRARDNLTINAGRDLNVDGFSDLASDGYGSGSGGDVVINTGRDINLLNSTGTDGSIGAEGFADGNVTLNAGPGGFVRLLASSTATLFSSSGDVTVNTDRIVINSTAGITANGGAVTLRPKTEGWAIDLGSATDGAFALELSDAEVDRIFTTTLTIGGSVSGDITASAAFGPAGIQNLQLISESDIVLTSAMTVTNMLTLRAGDNVHFLSGSATTAGGLDVFVDQAGGDGSTGGLNTFGGAVTAGTSRITGSVDADTLNGTSGDDVINGLGGSDVMTGGLGNDQYHVNSAGDVVNEAAAEGTDRIFASSNYVLTAGLSIETLSTDSTLGTTAITLVGNEIANNVFGNFGDNSLFGSGGNDTLIAHDGNDTLNGGTGTDSMSGGLGNDNFYVDTSTDTVSEAAGQGTDRIFTSSNYVLAAGVSIETLSTDFAGGTAAITLIGNELANNVYGNFGNNSLYGSSGNDTLIAHAGNDLLNGGAGADSLTGGSGADTFVFANAPGAGNVDSIGDYAVVDDVIHIDNAVFTGLPAGALAAEAFRTGTAAADADDRVIYNSATGALFFDADGNGAGAAVQFATLAAGLAMSAGEFFVI